MPTALTARVVSDRAALASAEAGWDALATACSRPFCLPTWLLAWWDHARPADSELAVVLVHEASTLVGVAPGFLDRGPGGAPRWRPLGASTCQRVQPLARPGHEREVASAIAAALHQHHPRPALVSFEGIAADSPWPGLLAAAWPGRAHAVRVTGAPALVLPLDADGYAPWLSGKSTHFRARLAKSAESAERAGARFRLADAASAPEDIEAFLRMHEARWQGRGGSQAVDEGVASMLRAAGPALVDAGRLRLWSLDLDGAPVASSLLLHAGSEVGYWLNGFDADYSDLEPAKVSILRVIEDAFSLGADRLDLGEGAFAYKRRYTDHEEMLLRIAVVPLGARAPRAALALAPALARGYVGRRLPAAKKARLLGNPPPSSGAEPPRFTADLVGTTSELADLAAAWDALVEAGSRPTSDRALLLAWWEHDRPAGSRLAVVVVRDREGVVVGLAPGILDRGPARLRRWRPLGSPDLPGIEPLAHPKQVPDVARAVARALQPHADALCFAVIDAESRWPALLAAAWPGPGAVELLHSPLHAEVALRLKVARFEAWREGLPEEHRKTLTKAEDTAKSAGATVHRVTPEHAVGAFDALPGTGTPGLSGLRSNVRELTERGRLELWEVRVAGRAVATRGLFSAGKELWAWRASAPPADLPTSELTLLAAVEAMAGTRRRRLLLGPQDEPAHGPFADHGRGTRSVTLLPQAAGPRRIAVALARRPRRPGGVASPLVLREELV